MKKEYETFVEDLKRALYAELEMDEGQICFEPKGGKFSGNGDRLFVECASQGNAREVCGIYIEDLYEAYKENAEFDDVVQEVVREINHARNAGFFEKTKNLPDYEKVRKDLFIRLLNVEQNREALRLAVYRTIGDIALALYMRIGNSDGCITSMKILKEYLKLWGMSEEEVMEEAMYNTYRISPPRLYHWEILLFDPQYEGEDFMDPAVSADISRGMRGNCISTTVKTNGAAAVFLPGVARRLGELLGADFYLVFTSIHEVMVHSDQTVSPEDLEEVLRDTIKEATPEEEFLSFRIYHYNREADEFTCLPGKCAEA